MRDHLKKSRDSLVGSLLVAHPALVDSNFRRTVILLAADGADGAMGVVVNRSLGKHLGELGGDFALGPLSGVPLFQGGPVQPEQIILAAWQKRETGFQLHMGVEPDKAGSLLGEEGTSVRAFLGYAGWSAGQLGKELKQNTWVVADPPSDLFAHPGDVMLWRKVLAREGDEWRLLAEEPDDPEQN